MHLWGVLLCARQLFEIAALSFTLGVNEQQRLPGLLVASDINFTLANWNCKLILLSDHLIRLMLFMQIKLSYYRVILIGRDSA
jgi:hypothetical protein